MAFYWQCQTGKDNKDQMHRHLFSLNPKTHTYDFPHLGGHCIVIKPLEEGTEEEDLSFSLSGNPTLLDNKTPSLLKTSAQEVLIELPSYVLRCPFISF
jgi:hypothetical protein